jgi:hypothetical protein
MGDQRGTRGRAGVRSVFDGRDGVAVGIPTKFKIQDLTPKLAHEISGVRFLTHGSVANYR